MTIKKTDTIAEVLEKKGEEAAEILLEAGMGCVGCAMASGETLEQGCKAHGISDKEIDEIVNKLNG